MQRPIIPDNAVPGSDPDQLIFCFDPWVHKIANRYKNTIEKTGAMLDHDDLMQAGRLGLLRAHKRYDPAGGASFLTFSFGYIRAAMRYEIHRCLPLLPPGALVSLDEPLTDDKGKTLSDIIEDQTTETAQEKIERMEQYAELHRAVDRLKNESKREIIKKTYFEDKDISQAAAELNMKPGAAYAAHKDALSILRRDYQLKLYCAPVFSVGLSSFRRSWSSAVERAVLWREKHTDEIYGQGAYLDN